MFSAFFVADASLTLYYRLFKWNLVQCTGAKKSGSLRVITGI